MLGREHVASERGSSSACAGLGHRDTFGGTTGSGCEHHLVTVKRSAGGSAARRMSREACRKPVVQSVRL